MTVTGNNPVNDTINLIVTSDHLALWIITALLCGVALYTGFHVAITTRSYIPLSIGILTTVLIYLIATMVTDQITDSRYTHDLHAELDTRYGVTVSTATVADALRSDEHLIVATADKACNSDATAKLRLTEVDDDTAPDSRTWLVEITCPPPGIGR